MKDKPNEERDEHSDVVVDQQKVEELGRDLHRIAVRILPSPFCNPAKRMNEKEK